LINAGLLGLLLGAGVCPNSNVTSRTGTTIKTYILQRSNNTFYMESPSYPSRDPSGSLRCGGLKFHLRSDFASDPYVPYAELSRLVHQSNIRPGNLEQHKLYEGVGLIVCPKRLTFDWVNPPPKARVEAAALGYSSGRCSPRSLRRNRRVVPHDLSDAKAKLCRRLIPASLSLPSSNQHGWNPRRKCAINIADSDIASFSIGK
jgi:hypothetical protein